MKAGEFIYARTNAEFLNKAFGTNYKGWQKSSWKYDEEWTVWMVRFNKENGGWTNTFISSTRIKQYNILKRTEFEGKPIAKATTKKRLVFEIDDSGFSRKYIFRGKFVYDEENSDPVTAQYLDLFSDEFKSII